MPSSLISNCREPIRRQRFRKLDLETDFPEGLSRTFEEDGMVFANFLGTYHNFITRVIEDLLIQKIKTFPIMDVWDKIS